MSTVWLYTLGSVGLVSLISFVGLLALSVKASHLKRFLLYFVSFAAGALFGDVFIHLLPELVEEHGFGLDVSFSILLGVIFLFVVEKIIHWRHCHHAHHADVHPFAWVNLFGDGVHNFIDGMIIAASYLVSIPVGIATTVAVILHEIPQEVGDFGILLHGGFTKAKALFLNFVTALIAVVGAIVALVLSNSVENLTGFLIPFAAGSFLYIAGADLIPELHKEVKTHRSFLQLMAFILGICVMAALLLLEH